MKKVKLTTLAKVLIFIILAAVIIIPTYIFGGFDTLIPKEKETKLSSGLFKTNENNNNSVDAKNDKVKTSDIKSSSDTLKVGVVTWGGYAGGQWYNRGFKSNKESLYLKNYGLKVDFIVNDDFINSREMFKAGEIDVLWGTIDSFPTEIEGLKEYKPKIIFQSDWSRGGDAIVARRGIETVEDLVGKKVSVAIGTPSHTFLIWLLNSSGIDYNSVDIIEAPSAIDSAAYFKAGKVDAAVVWSPDDEDCVASVSGSKVLASTKEASNIIADVFFAKEEFINTHKEDLKALVEGWMIGASEINSSDDIKQKAAKILSDGLSQPYEFTLNAIDNVRLTNYGDNINFFNINGDYKGMKGEDLYNDMSRIYNELNLAPVNVPAFRLITDISIIKELVLAQDIKQKAETARVFKGNTETDKTTEAFSSKKVSIVFPSGSYVLDENSKYIIQMEMGQLIKAFGNARIRVEGNTDIVGSYDSNVVLSTNRAKSVAEFLINEYKLDPNRIIIVGNGSNKPIADNSTEAGRSKNRRTDFELIKN